MSPRRVAAGLALLAGCAPVADAPVDDPGVGEAQRVAVLATASATYDSGALATVRFDGAAPRDVATLSGDAVVAADRDAVWVLQRLGTDTVRRYAPGAWRAPVWEASTGRGSNPVAVAACGGALLVARLEETSLLVLDAADGATLGTVALGGQADDDGIPEVADLAVDGDRALVALQRLDRLHGWTPDPVGRIAAVDCARRAVVEVFDTGPNPTLAASPDGVVVLAEDGLRWPDGGDPGAAIDLVDVDGARIVDAAFGADGRGAFVARDGDRHVIGCLDVHGTPVVLDTVDNYVADVAVDDRGRAWFAVRQGWSDPGDLGGVRQVDLDGCADAGTVATTLAPFSIAFY